MVSGGKLFDLACETIEATPHESWAGSGKSDANYPPPLDFESCHVWYARSDDAHPGIVHLLDATEQARLATLRRQVDRDHFIVGCGMVRIALSAYLGKHPAVIRISRACLQCGQPHGKPRLEPPGAPDVQFSISHAGGRIVAAFMLGMPVGIDIEPNDPHLSVDRLVSYALTREHSRLSLWRRLRDSGKDPI